MHNSNTLPVKTSVDLSMIKIMLSYYWQGHITCNALNRSFSSQIIPELFPRSAACTLNIQTVHNPLLKVCDISCGSGTLPMLLPSDWHKHSHWLEQTLDQILNILLFFPSCYSSEDIDGAFFFFLLGWSPRTAGTVLSSLACTQGPQILPHCWCGRGQRLGQGEKKICIWSSAFKQHLSGFCSL